MISIAKMHILQFLDENAKSEEVFEKDGASRRTLQNKVFTLGGNFHKMFCSNEMNICLGA
jgi:hypothetical protein